MRASVSGQSFMPFHPSLKIGLDGEKKYIQLLSLCDNF